MAAERQQMTDGQLVRAAISFCVLSESIRRVHSISQYKRHRLLYSLYRVKIFASNIFTIMRAEDQYGRYADRYDAFARGFRLGTRLAVEGLWQPEEGT